MIHQLAIDRFGKLKFTGLFVLMTMACIFAASLVHTPKADAILNPNPFPLFQIPTNEFNYLINCDSPVQNPTGATPAVVNWVSAAGQPGATQVNVAYGQTSVALQWNFAGIVCRPQAVQQARSHALSATAWLGSSQYGTVGPISPTALTLDFQATINGGNRFTAGAYRQAGSTFTYFSPPGGFTTTTTVFVSVRSRSINHFGSGIHGCILTPGAPVPNPNASNLDDYGPCPDIEPGALITINVGPRPNQLPTGSVSATCTLSGGAATIAVTVNGSDPDGGSPGVIAATDLGPEGYREQYGGVGTYYFSATPGNTYNTGGRMTDAQTGQDVGWLPNANPQVTCPRPAQAGSCTISSVPTIPEPGERFVIRVVITDSGGTYSPRLNSTTNPFQYMGTFLNGVGPASELGYNITSAGGTATINDAGVFNNSPGVYDIEGYFYLLTGEKITCAAEITIGTKPYVKFYGSDTWTGGAFATGATCPSLAAPPTTQANAYGFARSTPTGYAGASTQFSLSAYHDIDGFFSAANRAPAPGNSNPPKGLTFSNTNSATYGGNNVDGMRCITDYFSEARDPTLGTTAFTGGLTPNMGRRQYVQPTGDYPMPGLNIPQNTQIAIFVDGDVFIDDNVIYSGAGTLERLPYFVLIARGNIYIDQDVTRLDGFYIAQPTSATNGVIYTCSRVIRAPYRASTDDGLDIYQNCGLQLSINGGLVARQVKFLRVRGTLTPNPGVTGSQPREAPNFNTGAGTAAAEIINYTPEAWLGSSPLRRPGGPSGTADDESLHGTYDSIKTLPPIF